ncbi:MAG: putative exported protein [Pseudobdellovibrio sp.]|nr:putative exported protein [Pseudobdellovibrio sp.]
MSVPAGTMMVALLLTTACAGPTSPFGGVEVWSGDGERIVFKSAELPASDFSMSPKRQVLHKESDFILKFNLKKQKVAVTDNADIRVTYNNKDVTNTFLKSTSVLKGKDNSIQYIFNKLKLRADKHHNINVFWRPGQEGLYSRISYLPPVCSLQDDFTLVSTKPFKPAKTIITAINSTAKDQQLNPSLLAGLIAQESGFKSTRVSYAKAIGLTQITPIAEEEIKKLRPDWRSDPLIDELDVLTVNQMILNKTINQKQDWRLDPELAIEGGALYLNYLIDYWNIEENRKLLSEYPNISLTAVVLASYNSGALRVKNKIKSSGDQWIDDNELKEAFKYVNSVSSYCYHFSATE